MIIKQGAHLFANGASDFLGAFEPIKLRLPFARRFSQMHLIFGNALFKRRNNGLLIRYDGIFLSHALENSAACLISLLVQIV